MRHNTFLVNDVREENIEQRVAETNQHPAKPDQESGNGHLPVAKQPSKVNSGLRKGKSVLAMRRSNLSTGLELLNSQRAWTVVLGSQVLESFDHLGIVAEAKQILGRLAQSDDRDSENRHDEDDGATGEEHISPAPVVRLGAGLNVHAVPLLRHHESPSNETGDGLSKTPPSSQESEEPLLVARKIFKEDGCIQNEIAASTKA